MATKRYNGEEESLVDQDLADQEATMLKRAMDEGERDEKALPAGYKVEAEAPAAKPRSMSSGPGRSPTEASMRSGPGRSPTGASMSSGPGRKASTPSAEEARDNKVRNAYRAATDDIKSSIKAGFTSATTKSDAPQRVMPKGMANPRDVNAKMSKGFESGKSSISLPSAPKREVPAMLRDAAKNARGMGDDKPKFRASQGYAKGGSVSSASRRADGIATKGKTRGKMC